jgi:outer membrane protein
MNKRLLRIFISAIVVMMIPTGAFAADEPQTQPQVEVLTLDQCLQIAYENSKQLKAADKSVVIAKANLAQAESNLFPTLSYSIEELKYGIDYPSGYGSTEGSYGFLYATQNLYTGGMTTGTIKVAELNLNKALEEQRKTKQTLTYDVKSAYYQAWLAARLLKVAQASYDDLGQHEQQTRLFYKVGTKSYHDLLQAQVNHEGQKPALITAQNNLVLANMKLATVVGIEEDRQITASDDPSKVTVPQSLEFEFQKLMEQAYRDRPEIHELKLADAINKVQTQMAYAGYKPKVSLIASMGGVGTTALDYSAKLGTDWASDMAKDWVLALNITGNFFDGFKTPSAVTQGKATIEKAELIESYTRDTMRLEVRQALQTIHGDLETIAASKAQIDLAKENLRMTESSFHDGISTNMDVLDSELALDNASNSYYSALSAYLTALANLDLVLGKDY